MKNSQYRNLSEDELRETFLTAVAGPREDHNAFFDGFKYVHDILRGDPSAGVDQGLHLLYSCLHIDSQAYEQIHKGTAFYWLGIGAYRVHDHELAAFFFDAAVSEDLRAGADPDTNPTPALRFIQIEGEPEEQAARVLVQLTQARVQELIDNYNARFALKVKSPRLSIDGLRQKFLRPAVTPGKESWRSLATAFISFSLEWDYRNALLDIRPGPGTSEPFFLHLFKGCVLFESLLRTNETSPIPSNTRSLSSVLRYLHSQLGISSNLQCGNTNLPQIIRDLATADESIETSIIFASRIRNTIGHNLGWVVAIDKNIYGRLFRMITSSCLHAIATLYR